MTCQHVRRFSNIRQSKLSIYSYSFQLFAVISSMHCSVGFSQPIHQCIAHHLHETSAINVAKAPIEKLNRLRVALEFPSSSSSVTTVSSEHPRKSTVNQRGCLMTSAFMDPSLQLQYWLPSMRYVAPDNREKRGRNQRVVDERHIFICLAKIVSTLLLEPNEKKR